MIRNLLQKSINLSRVWNVQKLSAYLNKYAPMINQSSKTFNYSSLQSSKKFYFSSGSSFSRDQFEQIIQSNSTKNVNSETLLHQFIDNIREIDELEFAIEMGFYYQTSFTKRMEHDKAISICKTILLMLKDKFSDAQTQWTLYFLKKLVSLNYEIGKFSEATRQAENLYKQYNSFKKTIEPIELIGYIKNLSHEMIITQQITFALKYLQDALEIIEKQKNDIPKEILLEIYYELAGCYYSQGKFQESINYTEIVQEIIKENPNMIDNSHFALVATYVCYKELSQIEKSQEVLQELKKFAEDVNGIKLEDLNKNNFIPFVMLQKPISEEEQKIIDQEAQYELNDKQNKQSINIQDLDKLGISFLGKKEYTEGIQYYEEILNKLDPSFDFKKVAQVNERLISFYGRIHNYDKVLQLCLSSYNIFQKKRQNYLLEDNETFQILSNIKKVYYEKKDYKSSMEWGRKWHAYCNYYQLFNTFSNEILLQQLIQVYSYQGLKMYEEALDYLTIISSYIEKSKNKETFEYELNKIKCEIYNAQKKLPQAKECYKKMCDYLISHKNQPQYKEVHYQVAKQTAFICLTTIDEEGIFKYGQEYIESRKDFEKDEDYLQQRLQITYFIAAKSNFYENFQNSEKYALESLRLAQKINENAIEFESLLVLAESCLFQNKIDEGEKYYQNAEMFSTKFFTGNPQFEQQKIVLCKVKSLLLFKRKDFANCIKEIELSLQSNQDMTWRTNYQFLLLNELSQFTEFKEQTQTIVSKFFQTVNK